MTSINITDKFHSAKDVLHVLHQLHPTHPDGTHSLWFISVDEGDIAVTNMSLEKFQKREELASVKPVSIRTEGSISYLQRVKYTFDLVDGNQVIYYLYVEGNYVISGNSDIYDSDIYHGDGWKHYFGF